MAALPLAGHYSLMMTIPDDFSLACVIHRAIDRSRESGLDYVRQTKAAAMAVLDLRSDMTACQALVLVMRERSDNAQVASQDLAVAAC